MITREHIYPAVTLALITPACTELLSGSTPAPRFFLPWVFALLVLLYGVPMLLIRELFVRWKLGFPGLFLLGLAYGIYNEGIVAKTLLRWENVPIKVFDHYGFLGVNWAWAALIIPWHAFNATIFPIVVVTWLFPANRTSAWLSKNACVPASLPSVVIGVFFFFNRSHSIDSPGYLALFFCVLIGLILLSRQVPHGGEFLDTNANSAWPPVLAGILFHPIFIIGLCFMASAKLPAGLIVLAALLMVCGFYRLLVKCHWLSLPLFGLVAFGNYFAASLFHLFTSCVSGSVVETVVAVALVVICLIGIRVALRGDSMGSPAKPKRNADLFGKPG